MLSELPIAPLGWAGDSDGTGWTKRITRLTSRKEVVAIYQLGPVVYDWSGYTGVARCLCCQWAATGGSPAAIRAVASQHADKHREGRERTRVHT